MPKFICKDTIPCYVTWTYIVEADSLEEAQELVGEGAISSTSYKLGDCLDSATSEQVWSEE